MKLPSYASPSSRFNRSANRVTRSSSWMEQSHDGTETIAKLSDHVIRTHRGRARQLNAGARIANGEILLFLHADTTLPPSADCLIIDAMKTTKRHWEDSMFDSPENSLSFELSNPLRTGDPTYRDSHRGSRNLRVEGPLRNGRGVS